jgi:8-hydroxy-5-deazaflavin:NADPH oxidoreductase
MNIAIIGAGNVGGSLGKKWTAAGNTVTFGVRNPADPKHIHLVEFGRLASISDALTGAEVALLSLPGGAVSEFAAEYGANLGGKIVIDATNNPRSPVMNNLEALKTHAPQAVLVRAFSTLGWENFANPKIGGVQVDLFYCGRAPARPAVEQLIGEVGLRPVYLGDLDVASALDGMTRVWFALTFTQGRSRRIAFKLLEE